MSKHCQTENEISDARETFSSQISTAIDLLSVNVDALYNKVFCSCKDTSVTTISALFAPKQTAEYSSTWTAVIFSGVPFTSKRDDLSHIQTVMSEIGASARVISSQRFGRRMGNRPQLLRMFLSSRQDADSLLSLANKLRYSTDYVLRRVNITSDRSPAQVAASREQCRVHRSQFRAVQLFLGKTFYRSNKSTRLVSTRSAATCTPCLAMPGVQSSSLPSAASSTTTFSSSTVQPSEPCCPRGLPPTSGISSGLPTGSGAVSSSSMSHVAATSSTSSAAHSSISSSTTSSSMSHAAASSSSSSGASAALHTSQQLPPSGSYRYTAAVQRALSAGLHVVDVISDGACLFRAVSKNITGSENSHLTYRNDVISYMKDNASQFTDFGFVGGDPDEGLSFDAYLDKIANPNQEVGEFVLRSLAQVLKKPINVYYGDCVPRRYEVDGNSDSVDTDNCINIIYKDILNCNSGHYMALLPQPQGNSSRP
jgi:hypothetical protein